MALDSTLFFQDLDRIYLIFLLFLTIGIYFEFEYVQLYRQNFHLTPAYVYCTILYFHHYEVLFVQLLSHFLIHGFFWVFFFRSDLQKAIQNLRISYFKKSHFICSSRTFSALSFNSLIYKFHKFF